MPTEFAYRTLDVFTDERFAGNPLAVVFDAAGLDQPAMQAVAGEFNLSETVFVTAVDRAAAHATVRIFTPKAELPFAGHPTIGTALLLARDGLGEGHDHGLRLTLGMAAGAVPVEIKLDAGAAVRASFLAPGQALVEPPLDPALVAPSFGLEAADLGRLAPRPAGHGLRFLFVEVVSLDALARARVVTQPEALLAAGLDNGVYLFTRATGDATLRARLFAPLHGIAEDPATGSAVTSGSEPKKNREPVSKNPHCSGHRPARGLRQLHLQPPRLVDPLVCGRLRRPDERTARTAARAAYARAEMASLGGTCALRRDP